MPRAAFFAAFPLCAGLAVAQFQSMDESPYIGYSTPTGGNFDENTVGCPFGNSDDESDACEQLRSNLDTVDLAESLNRRSGEFWVS